MSTLVPCGAGDTDADSYTGGCDCDDANPQVWGTPGDVRDLVLYKDALDGPTLGWSAPLNPGGAVTVYDAIRTSDPSDFVTAATCLPAPDPSSLTRADSQDPEPDGVFCHLVRATNACPAGSGPLGASSSGARRAGRTCP